MHRVLGNYLLLFRDALCLIEKELKILNEKKIASVNFHTVMPLQCWLSYLKSSLNENAKNTHYNKFASYVKTVLFLADAFRYK